MKKMISLFVAAMALVMALSSCSVNGTPASMVGTWKMTESDGVSVPSGYEYLMRIDADDSVWNKSSYNGSSSDWVHTGDITKCTSKEITQKSVGYSTEYTAEYELTCTELNITYLGYTTKYVKQ